MQNRFRQFLASAFLIAIGTSASATNQLPFQVPFAFGSLGYAQEDKTDFVDGKATFEIGGGMFFSRNMGVFGSYSRSPDGITLPYAIDAEHPQFGMLRLRGTFETSFVTTLAFGAFIRRDLSQEFYVFSRLGVAYSRQDGDIFAEVLNPVRITLEDSVEFELTGAIGSVGVGKTITNKLDVTFMYTSRVGDLESKDLAVNTITTTTPADYQIGLLYKF